MARSRKPGIASGAATAAQLLVMLQTVWNFSSESLSGHVAWQGVFYHCCVLVRECVCMYVCMPVCMCVCVIDQIHPFFMHLCMFSDVIVLLVFMSVCV